MRPTHAPPPVHLPDATTDPGYAQQWHHVAVKASNSWNYLDDNGVNPGGMRDVIVAVIDTGVDYTHQDLAANMWVNAAEIPDNGIDDDGNGFVDDIHGASVVSDARSHSGDPMDLQGHGTHVAGGWIPGPGKRPIRLRRSPEKDIIKCGSPARWPPMIPGW